MRRQAFDALMGQPRTRGQYLLQARVKAQLDLATVADRVGRPITEVAEWESGTLPPTRAQLSLLVKAVPGLDPVAYARLPEGVGQA